MKARENPFATDRVLSVRYRFLTSSMNEVFEKLAAVRYRGAIVGPEGSGKTTLLEDLEPEFASRGFTVRNLRLTRDEPCFFPGILRQFLESLSSSDVVLFDGAEQMKPLVWRYFKWRSKRAAGLVITSHKPGLLPMVMNCSTTPELLFHITTKLLEEESPQIDSMVTECFKKHRGNLRDALRELYDLYA